MQKRKFTIATILIACILVLGSVIFCKNYFYFFSYKKLGGFAPVTLVYDAVLASYGSVSRALDLAADEHKNGLAEIYLNFDPDSLRKMLAALPELDINKYYSARLLYPDGQWRDVGYRLYSGDIRHWFENKPSLTIKTAAGTSIGSFHILDLVNPVDVMMLANPFGEYLARQFSIMTPHTQLVKLYINDEYTGVYQLTNSPDEDYLRSTDNYPGTLFVSRVLRNVWKIQGFEVIGDTQSLTLFNPMEEVTKVVGHDATVDDIKRLWRVIDKDKFSSWAALMAVVSGTRADHKHHQVFYLDPQTRKLQPVISDILSLGVILYPEGTERFTQKWKPYARIPLNEMMTPLMAVALSDPTFVHLRNKKIYEALTSFASPDRQIQVLNEMSSHIEQALYSDANKAGLQRTAASWYRIPYSNFQYRQEKQRVYDFINERADYVLQELDNVSVSYYPLDETDDDVTFSVDVSGQSAVEFVVDDIFAGYPLSIENELGEFVPFKSAYLLQPSLFRDDKAPIHPRIVKRRTPTYQLVPGKSTYRFKINNKDWNDLKKHEQFVFRNAVTGSVIKPGHAPILSDKDARIKHTLSFAVLSIIDDDLNPDLDRLNSQISKMGKMQPLWIDDDSQ